MRSLTILLLSLAAIIQAQYQPVPNEPCKPLGAMAARMAMLERASLRSHGYNYDVHFYGLDLQINPTTEIITGTVQVGFTAETAMDEMRLDLDNSMELDSLGGAALSAQHAENELTIFLDQTFQPGDTAFILIHYSGHPVESGFQAFAFDTQGGVPMISTLSEPYGARTWWPCKDIPTDKADSVDINITVPEAYIAVANGLLVNEVDLGNGWRRFEWQHRYPVTTYLISLAITNYTYWTDTYHFADGDSMPLEYWVYPSNDTETVRTRWRRTAAALDAYNAAYGKYPFAREKYGMAEFEWGGAMEHQTCSSMGSSGENTIVHELAHQWWGDLVTCANFHHIWINEGFATYSEALYWGSVYGEDAYHEHMATKDMDYYGSIYRSDTTNVWSIFNYIVYGKGAWVLHMLRHVVGEETFFDILAEYRSQYAFSHAATEDFQAVAEQVYGESLEWFFEPWIYGTGRPNYRWWWTQGDMDSTGMYSLTIHIDQTQVESTGTFFPMPVDIRLISAELDTTFKVWNAEEDQTLQLHLPFTLTDVELDPGNWILKTAQEVVAIDPGTGPDDFNLAKAYPNPFNSGTTLSYSVQDGFKGQLMILDLRGRLVQIWQVEHQQAGQYRVHWNARDRGGAPVSSGIYLIRLMDPTGKAHTRKVTLLK